jgi:hypothetical protein
MVEQVTNVGVGPRDTVSSEGGRLRVSWEVTGGIIPRQPMPEYTRRWLLTSETYYAEREQSSIATFERFQQEARDYARALENPGILNWVNVEWVYL